MRERVGPGALPRIVGKMTLRAGILSLALALLAAGPAQAAFDVTAFELTPSSTAAGAHADVTIATSFTRQELRVLVRDSDGSRPPVTLKVRPRRR